MRLSHPNLTKPEFQTSWKICMDLLSPINSVKRSTLRLNFLRHEAPFFTCYAIANVQYFERGSLTVGKLHELESIFHMLTYLENSSDYPEMFSSCVVFNEVRDHRFPGPK